MQKIRKILSAVLREKCSRTEPEFVDGQRRTTLGIRTLTSTDVENCNGGNHRAQRQSLKKLETIGKVTNIELRMKQLKQIEKLRKGKC